MVLLVRGLRLVMARGVRGQLRVRPVKGPMLHIHCLILGEVVCEIVLQLVEVSSVMGGVFWLPVEVCLRAGVRSGRVHHPALEYTALLGLGLIVVTV